VPNFRTPEACADAIAAALRRRAPRMLETPPRSAKHRDRTSAADGGGGPDELENYGLLDRIGIARAPTIAVHVNVMRAPALPFPYPVAVKAMVAGIAHNTDVGGVVLGVSDDEALLAAIHQIRTSVAERQPGTTVVRVLVQPMISGLGEVLIGYRVDRDVGPIVMVAAGGVFTEIYRDRALRLAPVDLATAQEMIAEVRGLTPLAGYRGLPVGDLAALAQAVVALSRLAVMDGPAIQEAEINPLIVRPAGLGVVAVDTLVKLMV
jgi:acyl-CoA synthetase (NDP forming)